MKSIDNNLFKAVLVSMLSLSVMAAIPAKKYEKPTATPAVLMAVAQTEQPIPQVIIVGKRLSKNNDLIAKR